MGILESSQLKIVSTGSSLFCVQENRACSGLCFVIPQGQLSDLICYKFYEGGEEWSTAKLPIDTISVGTRGIRERTLFVYFCGCIAIVSICPWTRLWRGLFLSHSRAVTEWLCLILVLGEIVYVEQEKEVYLIVRRQPSTHGCQAIMAYFFLLCILSILNWTVCLL